MTCTYCGKHACRHQSEKIASGSPRHDDLPPGGIGGREDLSTESASLRTTSKLSLFALGDSRELVCVLCAKVIPNGRDQAYLRAYHGKQHVRRGEAVEDRHGLPAGAVRYFLKAAP